MSCPLNHIGIEVAGYSYRGILITCHLLFFADLDILLVSSFSSITGAPSFTTTGLMFQFTTHLWSTGSMNNPTVESCTDHFISKHFA